MSKHLVIDGNTLIRRVDGIGRVSSALYSELIKIAPNNTYEFVAFSDQKDEPHLIPEGGNVSYTYIPIPRRVYSTLFKLGLAPSVNRWLKKQPDVIMYPNFVSTPKMGGAPKILSVHDTAYIDWPNTINKRNLSYLRKFVPKSIAESDEVLATSYFTERRVRELYSVSPKNLHTIQPGIDHDHFKPVKSNAVLKKYKIPKDYILFVGTIEPRKNIAKLLDGYMELDEDLRRKHALVLAGRPGWRTESLMEKIKQLQDSGEKIIVTGFFDDEDLPGLYSNAAVFVMTSTYEGFGIPVVEAMACGAPVASNNLSGLEEVVGSAVEVIDPNDTKSVHAGINELLTNPAKRKKLQEDGFKQASVFTWEASARKVAKIIESVGQDV